MKGLRTAVAVLQDIIVARKHDVIGQSLDLEEAVQNLASEARQVYELEQAVRELHDDEHDGPARFCRKACCMTETRP